jgi:hypothetical protein
MPTTSPLAAGIAVEGLLLQLGNGASPEVYTTIANVQDWNEPLKADTADVTNVGDAWRRRIATLLDMGAMKFKVFWVMAETTHWNQGVTGLRYLLTNRILGNWQIVYPNAQASTDVFTAYVTGFSVTGKVGGVFEAEVELSNNGQPVLC